MDPTSFSLPGTRPAAPATPGVIDVTEATFAAEVVERSRRTPVVLDLWASWCAPCRQLSPVLERLAAEAAGAWVLAKVDVDANPRLAQALQVQGIPAVKAIVDGQIVHEFSGALPEREVRAWLEQAGIAGPAEPAGEAGPEPDGRLRTALEAERRGDLDDAAAAYRAVLADDPGAPEARAGVARVDLIRRARAADVAALTRQVEADPDDVLAVAALADVDLASGRVDAAFDRLLAVVRRAAGEPRDTARRHLVELFGVLADDDPRVARARRDLASALF